MIHPDKNFLPAGYKRGTTPVNPITLPISQMTPTKEGDFEYADENIDFQRSSIFFSSFRLQLKMVSKWDKSDETKEEETEIYQMDENSAQGLHPVMDFDASKRDSKPPRLLGMIEENNEILPRTIFLSDFIRSSE